MNVTWLRPVGSEKDIEGVGGRKRERGGVREREREGERDGGIKREREGGRERGG